MEALLFAHSFLRWILLILLVAVIFKSFTSWFGQKPVITMDRKLAFWAMMTAHIQLVFGLILYFMNFKTYTAEMVGERAATFWKFEHIGTMIIAIALITMGRSLSKKAKEEVKKHKRIAIFYLLGLILILLAIPWPFRELIGRQWL